MYGNRDVLAALCIKICSENLAKCEPWLNWGCWGGFASTKLLSQVQDSAELGLLLGFCKHKTLEPLKHRGLKWDQVLWSSHQCGSDLNLDLNNVKDGLVIQLDGFRFIPQCLDSRTQLFPISPNYNRNTHCSIYIFLQIYYKCLQIWVRLVSSCNNNNQYYSVFGRGKS